MQTENTGGGQKGFLGSLFDLSFRHLITGRVVSFLYVVSLILVTLNALLCAGYACVLLGAFLSAVSGSSAVGWVAGVLLFLVVGPLFVLASVVYVRVLLEIVMVLFRIADNTAETSRRLGAFGASLGREATPGTAGRTANGG